jgi:hypothetical protein
MIGGVTDTGVLRRGMIGAGPIGGGGADPPMSVVAPGEAFSGIGGGWLFERTTVGTAGGGGGRLDADEGSGGAGLLAFDGSGGAGFDAVIGGGATLPGAGGATPVDVG